MEWQTLKHLSVLQNRVGELYSLVRFLRIYPYAFYFCNSGRSKCGRPFASGLFKSEKCGLSSTALPRAVTVTETHLVVT